MSISQYKSGGLHKWMMELYEITLTFTPLALESSHSGPETLPAHLLPPPTAPLIRKSALNPPHIPPIPKAPPSRSGSQALLHCLRPLTCRHACDTHKPHTPPPPLKPGVHGPPYPFANETGMPSPRGHTGATRPPRPPTASRSGSRVPVPRTPPARPSPPLWHVPETYSFASVTPETPSEGPIAYDPAGADPARVLPVSQYLAVIIGILEGERSWDVFMYVLCHPPVQLANKYSFCGPNARSAIARMLAVLSNGMKAGVMQKLHTPRTPATNSAAARCLF
ncbi:hypothetical protein DXG01_000535 [Tephrocybe rancida]|nr:hypothetical protein DXG01_000535 [Tephrocybe rancida]